MADRNFIPYLPCGCCDIRYYYGPMPCTYTILCPTFAFLLYPAPSSAYIWEFVLSVSSEVRYSDVFVAFDGCCQNSRSPILFFLTLGCIFYFISSLGWVYKVVTRSGDCILRRFAKFEMPQQCWWTYAMSNDLFDPEDYAFPKLRWLFASRHDVTFPEYLNFLCRCIPLAEFTIISISF
jgi:hypothetical protein